MARTPSRRRNRLLRRVALLLLLAILAFGLPNAWILLGTASHLSDLTDAPPRPIAIVLGASVRRDGRPSAVLADRLDTAAALLRNGRVREVLVSGDRDFEREYDEVGVMARYLQDHGVPPDAIRIDPHGFRTYDSMWRARHVYGVTQALVVTNAFHLPRAVWIGRQLGIDCGGVYPPVADQVVQQRRIHNAGREALARVVAFFDVLRGAQPAVIDSDQAR